MTTDATLYETAGGVARITLNRPENRNALSADLVNGLFAHLEAANRDADVRCIVLTGAGTAFCAGADLKNPPGSPVGDQRPITLPEVIKAILDSPKPVIVAVNGPALAGGTEIVLACDLVVAVPGASFGLPEVKRALTAAAGGLFRLPRVLPRQIALEMILTGEPISADRANQLGMVNRLVPAERLLDEAMALAARITVNAPVAVRESLRVARRANDLPDAELRAMTEQSSLRVRASDDFKEGPLAFIEKRAPKWTGR